MTTGDIRWRASLDGRSDVQVAGGFAFSTAAASAVAIGTEATRPMLPTRVRTISTATCSLMAVVAID